MRAFRSLEALEGGYMEQHVKDAASDAWWIALPTDA